MKRLFIPLFLLLIPSLMSTSRTTLFGIIRHDVPLSQYREMGARPDFKCVGRYSISETAKAYAAGVLIAPRWVLTAAHFVQDSSVWKFGEHFYATKKIVKHPQRRPNAEETQWNGWDMALVELKKPVLDIIPAVRYRGNTELGKTITKLGYGFLGDGQRGLSSPRSQEKLGGQNVVDAIGGTFEGRRFSTNVMICDFDDPKNPGTNQWGSPIPLELEIGGSKGDSGGGVFMEENGKTVLVGIVSGALNRRIKYGSVMALARVSTASVWIDSVIGP